MNATTHNPLLFVESLSFKVNDLEILRDINLSIDDKEFVCIVGASGCGKTTLLRMMAGLLSPTRGHVSYRGQQVVGPHREIAVVFQDYAKALLPWRTVAGNVSLALEGCSVPAAERPQRIHELLCKVGLEDRAEAFPVQLSGGMQQRLQIARCLAQSPQLLLMDEPFGALDAMTRQTLQDEVTRLCRDSGVTVVFITHDLEEAIYLGDRVISMEKMPGKIGETLVIDLPRPRDQLTTRENTKFLAYRHQLFKLLPSGH